MAAENFIGPPTEAAHRVNMITGLPARYSQFRTDLLAEARLHLDEPWVAYTIMTTRSSAANKIVLMGRSQSEAVIMYLDFAETPDGAAATDASVDRYNNFDGEGACVPAFFEADEGDASASWLAVASQDPPTPLYVPELSGRMTKPARD